MLLRGFIPAMVVFSILTERRLERSMEKTGPAEEPDWYDVEGQIRCSKFDEAIRIGEELSQKTPQYADGHRRLASAYLAAGKIKEARMHHAQAARLFPPENGKLWIAIGKRIRDEDSQRVDAAHATSPLR